jgi:outer membrane lipoprotein
MHSPLALIPCTVLLVVAGCVSKVPPAIRDGAASEPVTVGQVRRAPDRHLGERVRWGGSILSVDNLPDRTEIQVLSRPLGHNGRPQDDGEGGGRFLARIGGFVDPAESPTGRLLTVVGTVDGVETRAVGDYPYRYPVIDVGERYLWPEEQPQPAYYPWGYGYYGYGPWYSPWYGPRLWPWYGPW